MMAGGVVVRDCDLGLGVIADAGARKGEVCFTEAPFAAVQTLANRCRAPACAHCLSPLGPLAAVAAATCTGSGARALAAAHTVALSGEESDGLPALPGFEPHACAACACDRGCGAVFCAPACRSAARWHDLLCDGQLPGESHPLAEFRRHAERTSESFVLAARCVATALAAAVDGGGTPEAVEAAVASLTRFGFAGPWSSVASLEGPAPDVRDVAAHAAWKKKVKRQRLALKEQLEESHQLLAVGLQHRHRLSAEQYNPLLSPDLFSAVAGTVELGVVPITFESPLTRYCRALAGAPRADQARALAALRPVVEAAAWRTGVKLDDQGEPTRARRPDAARPKASSNSEEDDDGSEEEDGGGGKRARTDASAADAAGGPSASGIRWDDAPERVAASLVTLAPAIFSGVEGVAMGATASMMNHSCVPNVQIDTAAGGMLALVPLCDVAAGGELLVAYTATAAPRSVRHAELRKHRFACGCSRCAFDAAAEAGPQALEFSLAALPPPALLALGRQAQEEGRHDTAETLFTALAARSAEAAAAGIAAGEAQHALGVSRLAMGRWSAAHAAWAEGARAAPEHPALQAQAAKDGSYWPAPNAPCDEGEDAAAAAPPFTHVPLGAGSAVLTAAPLLDAAGCARVVAAAEAAASSGGGWTTARHYDVPTTDMPLHAIPPLLRWFNGAMRRSIAPLLAAAYPGGVFAGHVRVHDAFVVRYDAAQQRHLPVHRDQSVLSLTIALNPRTEFEGGGTYFADARTVVCPDAGHVLAFSGETRHGGEPITAGVRYIVAAFLYIADGE